MPGILSTIKKQTEKKWQDTSKDSGKKYHGTWKINRLENNNQTEKFSQY
jgi:hypothetical protein